MRMMSFQQTCMDGEFLILHYKINFCAVGRSGYNYRISKMRKAINQVLKLCKPTIQIFEIA